MSRSNSSDNANKSDHRTTLPPIRDLFRDELSRSPHPPYPGDPNYSPSTSLARLSLHPSDEDRSRPEPHDRYVYAHASRQVNYQLNEYPRGYAGHSALGLSSLPALPPLSSASTATSHSLPMPPTLVSSFPPHRPSSMNPTPGRAAHLADHYRSKSLSEASVRERSSQNPPYPDRAYHGTPPRAGSTLNPEVDWHTRHASVPHAQPFVQGSFPYGRNPSGTPGSQLLDPAGGVSGRGRSGSDTGVDRSTSGKYECPYCHKGFNRPSSLKIHINSHTGEKPFMCPYEGCGRTFSVLSNMRRHARVHTQPPMSLRESSSDDPEGSDGGGSVSSSPPMPLRSSSSLSAMGPSASSRTYSYPVSVSQTTGRAPAGHDVRGRRQGSGSRSRSSSSEEGQA
ncbi:hypothetical protein GLOTRDRAFT_127898 [Gloeophyllum trabeum ATCC 11539]|uniref:C2H2-type domain-containing protein n=1 Tax=Gloeophyllum trabeum (strain ATCC 11539 / FP-39264 / Madison 617) TaxID=670483 RepID=S7QDU1_GLOTA|nr:uncharacterized protein GLOTRDRAFT_127898 [Gloeophyllum trabeum ATCC 11539]EPQ57547.1 hypothetical protein GLOTRDRAFT_127898 [Gloeophyllum trabeum ATCC 11539]